MFRKANRVSRPDKALILGFMAGLRENPRPNTENVLVIKLGETEVRLLEIFIVAVWDSQCNSNMN